MLRPLLVSLTVLALLPLFLAPALAEAISSTDLIEKSRSFDGKTVSYKGEVVGDVMVRGDYAWINVNDGVNAMGVWILAAETAIIKVKGDYDHHGDTVEVTGVFNRADAEHGGDMDIHATDIRLVKSGHPLEHPIYGSRIAVAVILSLASGLLFLTGRRLRRRRV